MHILYKKQDHYVVWSSDKKITCLPLQGYGNLINLSSPSGNNETLEHETEEECLESFKKIVKGCSELVNLSDLSLTTPRKTKSQPKTEEQKEEK